MCHSWVEFLIDCIDNLIYYRTIRVYLGIWVTMRGSISLVKPHERMTTSGWSNALSLCEFILLYVGEGLSYGLQWGAPTFLSFFQLTLGDTGCQRRRIIRGYQPIMTLGVRMWGERWCQMDLFFFISKNAAMFLWGFHFIQNLLYYN